MLAEVRERRSAQRAAREALVLAPLEEEAREAAAPAAAAVDVPPRPAPRPAPGSVVGRIRIESAGVDVMALEGIGDDVLRR